MTHSVIEEKRDKDGKWAKGGAIAVTGIPVSAKADLKADVKVPVKAPAKAAVKVPVAALSDVAMSKLKAVEAGLVTLRAEHGFAMTSEGTTLIADVTDNQSDTIDLIKYAPMFLTYPGAIFTHNHPAGWGYVYSDPMHEGNSFSDADVLTAVNYRMSEIRAVTPVWTYSMKMPPLKPGTRDEVEDAQLALNRKVAKVYRQTMTEVVKGGFARINSGKSTVGEATARMYNDIWAIAAPKLGFDYSRTLNEGAHQVLKAASITAKGGPEKPPAIGILDLIFRINVYEQKDFETALKLILAALTPPGVEDALSKAAAPDAFKTGDRVSIRGQRGTVTAWDKGSDDATVKYDDGYETAMSKLALAYQGTKPPAGGPYHYEMQLRPYSEQAIPNTAVNPVFTGGARVRGDFGRFHTDEPLTPGDLDHFDIKAMDSPVALSGGEKRVPKGQAHGGEWAKGDTLSKSAHDVSGEKRDKDGQWVKGSGDPRVPLPELAQVYSKAIQSPSFKAWFGDWDTGEGSKVKGKDGKPAVNTHTHSVVEEGGVPVTVYHGTSHGGFTTFDKAKLDPDSLWGAGFYFTQDVGVAESYTNKGSNRTGLKIGIQDAKERLFDRVSALTPEQVASGLGIVAKPERRLERGQEGKDALLRTIGGLGEHEVYTGQFMDLRENLKRTGVNTRDIFDDDSETKKAFLNIRNPLDIDKKEIGEQGLRDIAAAWNSSAATLKPSAYNPPSARMGIDDFSGKPTLYLQDDEIGIKELPLSATGEAIYSVADMMARDDERVGDVLSRMGFDGITHIGGSRMGGGNSHRVWIAWEPNQIKAVENEGTFDPNNADMYKGTSLSKSAHDVSGEKRDKDGQWVKGSGDPRVPLPELAQVYSKAIQSPSFKAWFGDWDTGEGSKVKGKDGKPAVNTHTHSVVEEGGVPVVVYHGTSNGGFTTFDKSKLDDGALWGAGFYFTQDEGVATSYKNKDAGRVYLNRKLTITDLEKVLASLETSAPAWGDTSNLWYEKEVLKRKLSQPYMNGNDKVAELTNYIQYNSPYGADIAKWLGAASGPELKKAFLNIRNPLDIDTPIGAEGLKSIADAWNAGGLPDEYGRPAARFIPSEEGGEPMLSLWRSGGEEPSLLLPDYKGAEVYDAASHFDGYKKTALEILSRMGFDGITHIGGNRMGGGKNSHRVWIAWEPNQIKAVENEGTFDPNNADMYKGTSLTKSAHDVSGEKRDEDGQWVKGSGYASSKTIEDTALLDAYKKAIKSPKFKAWFGNWESKADASKAVDKDGKPAVNTHTHSVVEEGGKPVVVYHGTSNNAFNTFDTAKQDPQSLYGAGFYFTQDEGIANSYQEKEEGRITLSRPVTDADMARLKKELSGSMKESAWATHSLGSIEFRQLRRAVFGDANDPPQGRFFGLIDFMNSGLDSEDVVAKHLGITRVKDVAGTKKVFLNIRNPIDMDAELTKSQVASMSLNLSDAGYVIKPHGKSGAFDMKLAGSKWKPLTIWPDITGATTYNLVTGYMTNEAVRNQASAKDPVAAAHNESPSVAGALAATKFLKDAGFDGITHIGGSRMGDGYPHRVWIAFGPNQVKAIENEGNFDPADNNIMKAATLTGTPVRDVSQEKRDANGKWAKTGAILVTGLPAPPSAPAGSQPDADGYPASLPGLTDGMSEEDAAKVRGLALTAMAMLDYEMKGVKAPLFKAWFGDWEEGKGSASKVVNPDGTPAKNTHTHSVVEVGGQPVVVYHGTAHGGFTKFDKLKQDPQSLYGAGFYFTQNKSVAETYENKDKEIDHLSRNATAKDVLVVRAWFKSAMAKMTAGYEQSKYASVLDLTESPYQLGLMLGGTSILASKMRKLTGIELVSASGNQEVKQVYLNIRNPFMIEKPVTQESVMEMANSLKGKGYMLQAMPAVGVPSYYKVSLMNGPSVKPFEMKAGLAGDFLFDKASGYFRAYASEQNAGDASEQGMRLTTQFLKDAGFDGITHTGGIIHGSTKHKVWIAFEPNQIKAVENEGTFDASDDIMKAVVRDVSGEQRDKDGKWIRGSGNASVETIEDNALLDAYKKAIYSPKFKSWFGDWQEGGDHSQVTQPDGKPAMNTHSHSVVEEGGEPVAVYHGTANGGFTTFDKAKLDDGALWGAGFYFTQDKGVAESYQLKDGPGWSWKPLFPRGKMEAEITKRIQLIVPTKANKLSVEDAQKLKHMLMSHVLDWSDEPMVFGGFGVDITDLFERHYPGETKKVFLNIRQPFDIDAEIGTGTVKKIKDAARGIGLKDVFVTQYATGATAFAAISRAFSQSRQPNQNGDGSKTRTISLLASIGFDGITHIGGDRMGGGHQHRVWIAWEPNQVKAVENEGAFSTASDDIMKAAGGKVHILGIDVLIKAARASAPKTGKGPQSGKGAQESHLTETRSGQLPTGPEAYAAMDTRLGQEMAKCAQQYDAAREELSTCHRTVTTKIAAAQKKIETLRKPVQAMLDGTGKGAAGLTPAAARQCLAYLQACAELQELKMASRQSYPATRPAGEEPLGGEMSGGGASSQSVAPKKGTGPVSPNATGPGPSADLSKAVSALQMISEKRDSQGRWTDGTLPMTGLAKLGAKHHPITRKTIHPGIDYDKDDNHFVKNIPADLVLFHADSRGGAQMGDGFKPDDFKAFYTTPQPHYAELFRTIFSANPGGGMSAFRLMPGAKIADESELGQEFMGREDYPDRMKAAKGRLMLALRQFALDKGYDVVLRHGYEQDDMLAPGKMTGTDEFIVVNQNALIPVIKGSDNGFDPGGDTPDEDSIWRNNDRDDEDKQEALHSWEIPAPDDAPVYPDIPDALKSASLYVRFDAATLNDMVRKSMVLKAAWGRDLPGARDGERRGDFTLALATHPYRAEKGSSVRETSWKQRRILGNIGYNKNTQQIRMLNNLGIRHTVTDAHGHSQTGQWGFEPNVHIRLHDVTETDARRVASMFGKGFQQDGIGLTHGGQEEEYQAHQEGHGDEAGFHPVLGVGKASNHTFSTAEVARVGRSAARQGVTVETNEDHTRLDFHHYAGSPEEWQTGVRNTLRVAGLDGEDYLKSESAVKSDYIGKEDYQRNLYAGEGPYAGDSQTEAGSVLRGHSDFGGMGKPGAFVHATLALARSQSQSHGSKGIPIAENKPGAGYLPRRPRVAHPGPATSVGRD